MNHFLCEILFQLFLIFYRDGSNRWSLNWIFSETFEGACKRELTTAWAFLRVLGGVICSFFLRNLWRWLCLLWWNVLPKLFNIRDCIRPRALKTVAFYHNTLIKPTLPSPFVLLICILNIRIKLRWKYWLGVMSLLRLLLWRTSPGVWLLSLSSFLLRGEYLCLHGTKNANFFSSPMVLLKKGWKVH